MEITKYFISVGFRFDPREMTKLHRQFSTIERQFKTFAARMNKTLRLDINKFHINDRNLTKALGTALDSASRKVSFEVSKFVVNDRNLQAALLRASRRVRGYEGTAQPVRTPQAAQMQQPRSRSRAESLHMGGSAGALARYGLAGVPLIGGAYGIGMLNSANQELMSTEIAAGAIFGDRATQSKQWLEKHSDYVGYNYLETMPIFSSFMASSMPLMGYDQSLGVFESLAEFGRTRGADSVGMKRAMTAIQQMASKGQVMSEELKLQLSEAKGFGESRSVFAEANQIRKGGNKTGAEAASELLTDMAAGNVKSADILPIVAKLFKELAKGGIEAARTSSIAQQARFQNEQTRGLRVFSENGGEQGFARMWGTLAEAMKSAQPLIKALAGTFEDLTRVLQAPVYLFGRLTDLLSTLSETTGIAEKNFTNLALVGGLMATKWGRVGLIFTSMLVVLEDIAMGVSGEGDSLTGRFLEWLEKSGIVMGPLEKGLFGVSAALLAIATALKAVDAASSLGGVKDILGGGSGKGGKATGGLLRRLAPYAAAAGVAGGVVGATAYGVDYLMEDATRARNQVAERWNDPLSPYYNNPNKQLEAQSQLRDKNGLYYNDPAGLEQFYKDKAMAEMEDKMSSGNGFLPGISKMDIKADIQVTAGTADEAATVFESKLQDIFREAASNFSYGTQ